MTIDFGAAATTREFATVFVAPVLCGADLHRIGRHVSSFCCSHEKVSCDRHSHSESFRYPGLTEGSLESTPYFLESWEQHKAGERQIRKMIKSGSPFWRSPLPHRFEN